MQLPASDVDHAAPPPRTMLNTIHHPTTDAMLPVGGCALASRARGGWPQAGLHPMPPGVSPGLPRATLAMPGAGEDTRAVVQRFIDLLYHRRQVCAAFESCVVAHGYRDHAWHGRGSRAGVMRALARRLADTELQASLQHLVVDGAMAMAHLQCHARGTPPHARVEIYRVADGRIAEHWSVCAAASSLP